MLKVSGSFSFDVENEEESRVLIKKIEELVDRVDNVIEEDEKIYSVQSYMVKFDLGPVDVNINVYHTDKTRLTRDEIIEEALGYAVDRGIDLSFMEVFEIETLEMEI